MNEDLELEGEPPPPAPRPRPKVLRDVRLTAELARTIRQIAAINGVSLSETVSRLLEIGLDLSNFPVLPPKTRLVSDDRDVELAASRYFIPAVVSDSIDLVVGMGYSLRYVMETAIERGISIVKGRRHTKKREAVDTATVHTGTEELPGSPGTQVDPELPESPEDGI